METNKINEYHSFYPIHPFEIVKDEIEARGLTKKEFAESIGMKPSNFSRMIKKKGTLTSEMALKLESVLGIPFSHWMRYQEEYMKDCVRLNNSKSGSYPTEESSQSPKATAYEDFYAKITIAMRPIKDRMDRINSMILSQNADSPENLSKEQIVSIENDIHMLGKALCELRLS